MNRDYEIDGYINEIIQCIKCKNYHASIKAELKNHIDDSKQAFVGQGMSYQEAKKCSFEKMGDSLTVGTSLNRAYQPQYDKHYAGFMLLLLVLSTVMFFSTGIIVNGLMIFLSNLLCGFIGSMKAKKTSGIIVFAIIGFIPIIVAAGLQIYGSILIQLVNTCIILMYSIRSD